MKLESLMMLSSQEEEYMALGINKEIGLAIIFSDSLADFAFSHKIWAL